MVAIRARFDGKALIPQEPVELPRDRMLIIHVEAETGRPLDDALLKPVLTPTDREAALRLIRDPEMGLENI